MPQSIISQFEREYNSPIETRRQVTTSTVRDNIPTGVRWRGMLVHVIADDVTYELVGGIDNGSWQPLTGLQDAPSDGETYGRRNGAWAILNLTSGSSTLIGSIGSNSGNTAGNIEDLFVATVAANRWAVGDVARIQGRVTVVSESGNQLNYTLAGETAGIAEPASGDYWYNITIICNAIGASGSFAIIFSIYNDNGDTILITQYSEIGVDTTVSMEIGVNGGGTTANNVVVNSGTIEYLMLV